MKLWWTALLATVMFLCPRDAKAQCAISYVPHSADERELIRIETDWCDAAVHRDAARLERIFADDVSWIEDVGYRNKAQVMNRYMVEIQEHGWQLSDVRIRLSGKIAVVSAHIHVKKTVAGQTTESDHTALDVFEKRKGRWLLVVE